ncbi:vanadium-dependent haloperoxidase [Algibacillus agarilyticus]|uniref:vanadium-dependent haloperoxidase n=1 Tax=Algibacillus agarilyticus TaxID=2234133 RepID=UPI000DCFF0DB|nr:vanadium-dependent haloperoxidase [Algibacillus agarilyticus]
MIKHFTGVILFVFLLGCNNGLESTSNEEVNSDRDISKRTEHSIARMWNEVLLEAIRNDFARPTVHARNLWHVSAAMYDAWSFYESSTTEYLLGNKVGHFSCLAEPVPITTSVRSAQEEAISYAAYRIIIKRFSNSPGARVIKAKADTLMASLGYDTNLDSLGFSTAAAVGNSIAACYLSFGLQDGSNEENDYANQSYKPVNPPLILSLDSVGNPDLVDFNRWQPLDIPGYIDQAGNPITEPPAFLGAEWGNVQPFSLSENDKHVFSDNGIDYPLYFDPGMPPLITGELSDEYKWTFAMVAIWSAQLDQTDNVLWDISPNRLGNISSLPDSFKDHPHFYSFFDGGDKGQGYAINPKTGEPYKAQWVPRGDYTRVLAEFWADGPDSETPPGHWFVILNMVNDHPELTKKWAGTGSVLTNLEWDIKSYFALGGALHDSAIAAWGVKGRYDYIRPVSAIRAMAELGQSSDSALPAYHVNGLPLYENYIELVQFDDPLVGPAQENLHKIKIKAWRGPRFVNDPENDQAGVGWILAENWWPYQRPSFVTPPFAGYVSGHSTFSRAAAELLTAITGDEYFPGGMSEFHIKANAFLVFEQGPSRDLTLQWATYRDASDQCSLSRIWGGIHPPADDIPGRLMGERIGKGAFEKAQHYFNN